MDIYSILKMKANDDNYKNKIIYYEVENEKAYTFEDILNLVDAYIEMFSQVDLRGKKKYVIVDNSVYSVAVFIALLKSSAKPILINKLDLVYEGNKYNSYLNEIDIKNKKENFFENLKYDYIIANSRGAFFSRNEEIYSINRYINNIEQNELDDDCDFYISTSGTTTGIGKLIPIKEEALINDSINSDKDYRMLTCVPISSISGIILGVYRPIISNVENYMIYNRYRPILQNVLFKIISTYHINKALLPVDVLDMLSIEMKNYDFSNLDTLYLGGEVNNIDIISKIMTYAPQIKIDVFVSIYGRTENYGNICSCRGKEIKSIFIDVINSNSKELVYTFDFENIYKLSKKNGQKVIEKTTIYNDKSYYASYLSVSNKVLDNVEIAGNNIVGEIIATSKNTGDIGLYLDNQLYVLGRKDDIITIDGKEYFLSMIEQVFAHITKAKTSAIYDEKKNKIFVVVDCAIPLYANNTFKYYSSIAHICNNIIDKNNLPIEYPLFVVSDFFPKNKLLHKTKKVELRKMIKQNDVFQDRINNYDDSFTKLVHDIILEYYSKDVFVKYLDGWFYFKKSEISFDELIDFEKFILGYTHFSEDDEYYKFVIDDILLFNKYPDFNYNNCLWSDTTINRLKTQHKQLDRNNFYKFFSRIYKRNYRLSCMKLFGMYSENDDYYIYIPYQIAGNNSTHGIDKIYGLDLPYSSYSDRSIIMVYLETADNEYYDECELEQKIIKYRPLLGHTYKIKKSNKDFYIDDAIANKNSIIYKALIEDNLHFLCKYQSYYHNNEDRKNSNICLDSNNLIYTNDLNDIHEIIDGIPYYNTVWLYEKFKIMGVDFRDTLNYREQINLIINEMISSLGSSYNGDLGLIIYPKYNNELCLCKDSSMELFNLTKKQTIKKMYDLIKNIRKIGEKSIIFNGKEYDIDLSRVKLVIIACEKDISDVDYIQEIIDDCNVIKWQGNNKVLRKESKNEY